LKQQQRHDNRVAVEVNPKATYFRGVVLVMGPTARMLPLLSPQTTLVRSLVFSLGAAANCLPKRQTNFAN
jgi:hypothetical protein